TEAGRPLAMIFPDRDGDPRQPKLGARYIPITLAAITRCPNPTGAKRLSDYLLSPEDVAELAEGPSDQIPLNANLKARLPPGLATSDQVKVMQGDWEKANDRWDESQRFLANEFGR